MRPASLIIARSALASIDMLGLLSDDDKQVVREEVASMVAAGALPAIENPTSADATRDPRSRPGSA